jgi:hypothetical protein
VYTSAEQEKLGVFESKKEQTSIAFPAQTKIDQQHLYGDERRESHGKTSSVGETDRTPGGAVS